MRVENTAWPQEKQAECPAEQVVVSSLPSTTTADTLRASLQSGPEHHLSRGLDWT